MLEKLCQNEFCMQLSKKKLSTFLSHDPSTLSGHTCTSMVSES